MSDAGNPDHTTVATAAVAVVDRLPRAQVFARDPEEMTPSNLAQVVEELTKINLRNRKARDDDAAIAEAAIKMKKTNAANKKKPKAGAMPADILEVKL
jgi:hypothetical protein